MSDLLLPESAYRWCLPYALVDIENIYLEQIAYFFRDISSEYYHDRYVENIGFVYHISLISCKDRENFLVNQVWCSRTRNWHLPGQCVDGWTLPWEQL